MASIDFPEWAELAILGAGIYGGLKIARHHLWRDAVRAMRHVDSDVKAKRPSVVRHINVILTHSPKRRVRT